jgi:PAS domain S-box-containing protein
MRRNTRIALLGVGEISLLLGLWWGISSQMNAMTRRVNDVSELKDPSPFRAALAGYLGKIHVGLQGYLHSPDPTLLDQVAQSRKDFEASLPEFQKENARLFPQIAVDEIRRSFAMFQESVDHTLDENNQRLKLRETLDQNFSRLIYIIEHNIKLLIHEGQPDVDERREAILNVENQARAWQQNLVQAWAQPSSSSLGLISENDSRGGSYLERYAGLELLPREKSLLKELRQLWQSNGDLTSKSFALEKIVTQSEGLMDAQRSVVSAALNKFLPALPPAELQARKEALMGNIRWHMAATFLLAIIGTLSLVGFSLASYRIHRGEPVWKKTSRPTAARLAVVKEPTVQMDLQGRITGWTTAAETLYGYSEMEMRGQSIAKLFDSESEISRLYRELQAAQHTSFETIHKAKNGQAFPIRIEFRPITDVAGQAKGIGLVCSRR